VLARDWKVSYVRVGDRLMEQVGGVRVWVGCKCFCVWWEFLDNTLPTADKKMLVRKWLGFGGLLCSWWWCVRMSGA